MAKKPRKIPETPATKIERLLREAGHTFVARSQETFDRNPPDRMCGGKKRYTSKAFADLVARQRGRRIGETLGSYRCLYCNFYHIGHP
jgi:hypothetical protein